MCLGLPKGHPCRFCTPIGLYPESSVVGLGIRKRHLQRALDIALTHEISLRRPVAQAERYSVLQTRDLNKPRQPKDLVAITFQTPA